MISVINTFWANDNIPSSRLKEHFRKFMSTDNVEILICIDNCDSDSEKAKRNIKTLESYKKYGFKILKNNHQGFAGGCRNIGLEAAVGDYVIFIDSWNDTLDSGKDFNIKTIVDTFKEFQKRAPLRDVYEFSNHFNKFYRANVWNVFYKRSFLEEHHLRFIEWQGYEDFAFNFVIFDLNATITMYLEQSQELLLYPSYERIKCRPIRLCYNHAFADTKVDYTIRDSKRFNEVCDYYNKYLGRVPVEYIIDTYQFNVNTELGKEIVEKYSPIQVPKINFYKYMFSNIEERFTNPEHVLLPQLLSQESSRESSQASQQNPSQQHQKQLQADHP